MPFVCATKPFFRSFVNTRTNLLFHFFLTFFHSFSHFAWFFSLAHLNYSVILRFWWQFKLLRVITRYQSTSISIQTISHNTKCIFERMWPEDWEVFSSFSFFSGSGYPSLFGLGHYAARGLESPMRQHDKIFNNLSIWSYHFHSLCLLILMPYHLYFLCSDSLSGWFFSAVRARTL